MLCCHKLTNMLIIVVVEVVAVESKLTISVEKPFHLNTQVQKSAHIYFDIDILISY